ncbi:MAG: hypothetical protein ACXWZ1_09855 [Gaiellaceae bacterium]
MRKLMALLALVAALALGVPAAFATSATDSRDGLTVTVSLSDTATAGEPFTVAESIANTTTRPKLVRVTQTLAGRNGTLLSFSYPFFVPAQSSRSFSLTFRFPDVAVPHATYSLTLRANTASATATTVVS